MRVRLLMLYIRLIERYLGLPQLHSYTTNTQDFLENAWAHAGFREYVTKRNQDIIYDAAGGAGMAPADRVKYNELIGRRVENLYISALAKKSFEAADKRKRAKVG